MLAAAAAASSCSSLVASAATALLGRSCSVPCSARVAARVSLGFYLVGSFLLLAGFFVGEPRPGARQGRLRRRRRSSRSSATRRMRWATLGRAARTINISALFVVLGFVLC